MAEDMYLQEHYQMDPSKEERVPLKWMPIESIEDGICNEKTDVVSNISPPTTCTHMLFV